MTIIIVTLADQREAIRLRTPNQNGYHHQYYFACPVGLAMRRATRQEWVTCSLFADVPYSRSRAGHVYVRFPAHVTEWMERWEAEYRACHLLCLHGETDHAEYRRHPLPFTPLPPLRFEIPYDLNRRNKEQLTAWGEWSEQDVSEELDIAV